MSDILDDKSTKQPCIWCQRPRMRNDLCNRCRQRVESRARKIVQTKLIGDMSVITDALLFMSNQITSTPELFNITHLQYNELLTQALPFICLKFQAEMTYQGTRNQTVWNVAESTIRMVFKHYCQINSKNCQSNPEKSDSNTTKLDKVQLPTLNGIEIDSLKRTELCELLQTTVLNKIQQFELSNNLIASVNANKKSRSNSTNNNSNCNQNNPQQTALIGLNSNEPNLNAKTQCSNQYQNKNLESFPTTFENVGSNPTTWTENGSFGNQLGLNSSSRYNLNDTDSNTNEMNMNKWDDNKCDESMENLIDSHVNDHVSPIVQQQKQLESRMYNNNNVFLGCNGNDTSTINGATSANFMFPMHQQRQPMLCRDTSQTDANTSFNSFITDESLNLNWSSNSKSSNINNESASAIASNNCNHSINGLETEYSNFDNNYGSNSGVKVRCSRFEDTISNYNCRSGSKNSYTNVRGIGNATKDILLPFERHKMAPYDFDNFSCNFGSNFDNMSINSAWNDRNQQTPKFGFSFHSDINTSKFDNCKSDKQTVSINGNAFDDRGMRHVGFGLSSNVRDGSNSNSNSLQMQNNNANTPIIGNKPEQSNGGTAAMFETSQNMSSGTSDRNGTNNKNNAVNSSICGLQWETINVIEPRQ